MPHHWQARAMRLTLPLWLVRTMWGRARQWHVEAGGRFDPSGTCLFVWAGRTSGEQTAQLAAVAAVHVHWQQPTSQEATFFLMEWDPSRGGSAEMVWQALDVLAGETLPRSEG